MKLVNLSKKYIEINIGYILFIFVTTGAPTVLGQENTSLQSLEKSNTSLQSLEKSANLSTFFDHSGDFNFLSTFEDCLFGFTSPSKDSEMSSPDQRTRKCSISDIIDVINEEQNLLKNSKCLKDEGYSSSHSSSSSNDETLGRDNLSLDGISFDEEESKTKHIVHHQRSNKCSKHPDTRRAGCRTEMSDNSLLTFTQDQSPSVNRNVFIIVKHNNKTQLLNTTKEKLQIILGNQQTKIQTVNQGESNDEVGPSATEVKKRGRKRIYIANTDTEREDSKRVRNNEACKKFRKCRTTKIKSLFEQESTLLEKNLNLKEQVAALQRQVIYIKGKLGMTSS